MKLTRSTIAIQFELNPETIRYYETVGILNPKRDPGSGYRIYSENDKIKLDLTLRFKKFGFTLQEIRQFFDLAANSRHDKDGFNNFLSNKIIELDKKMMEISSLKESLLSFKSKEDVESCSILSKLLE